MRSVMQHNFSMVPRADIQRSSFNRSHGYKTTFNAGYIVPIFCDEALPGDTFNLRVTGFARLNTLLHPIMDNLKASTFFFAVPIRLIWDNWQRFNGEQRNPGDSTDFLVPQVPAPATTGFVAEELFDYFGLPTGVDNISVSAFWSRAYNLIYNEWFRDENLQDSVVVDFDDGPDDPADYKLLRRGKRHDYFTSALPWPQKGPAVPLPLTGNAPVKGIGTTGNTYGESYGTVYETGALATQNWNTNVIGSATRQLVYRGDGKSTPGPFPNIYADLSEVAAATINQIREAFQIQKLYERDARGGTRYIEILKAHFGVTSPDARLQRPEYLGGGTSDINVTPIAQTSAVTSQPTPTGNLSAMGTMLIKGHGFTKSFVEHCVILGFVSVSADLNYQQGINRMWSRETRWDFYWPALAHIGEQAILNKEIYAQGTVADDSVFGYQERFAEYRYKPSVITGQLRSNYPQSLDTWHLAQDFDSLPLLNDEFIVDNPPVERVVAVPTYPDFIFDSFFDLRCARPMPVFSVPGLIDHF